MSTDITMGSDGSQAAEPNEPRRNSPSGAERVAEPAYRVLARKYRPSSFEDLIGQEAMVRTLSNAFDIGRIHQAYMLTGVRGVGKTTTARILARAFNYELPARDGKPAINRPTIHMSELGVHCREIIESRHIDVLELDAASHTGVDDMRDIIENARFRPVTARTKVYIIDEVHMLSKSAFNALLKTLEEPPDHVKFLFATTEIDKVPITVRSRCQRFDLRRVDGAALVAHLHKICSREDVAIEPDALALIARAAEGSVRDALSLLDQAIAHVGSGGDPIKSVAVNDMLGLADRSRIIDLFEMTMQGDASSALTAFKDLYDRGADPASVLTDLAEFTHFVTRLKTAPGLPIESATPEERGRGRAFADSLSASVLARAWQILVKGLQEAKESPRPAAAADMVLVRLAYAADLPTPADLLRRLGASSPSQGDPPRGRIAERASRIGLGETGVATARAVESPAPKADVLPQSKVILRTFADLVALAQSERDIQLKIALERDVQLVRFEQGSIEFSLAPGASPNLAHTLTRRLQEWTGTRWLVAVVSQDGASTLREQTQKRQRAQLADMSDVPLVRAILEKFPGAQIVDIRSLDSAPETESGAETARETGDEISYLDIAAPDEDA